MGSLENPSVTLDDGRDCLRQAAASEDKNCCFRPKFEVLAYVQAVHNPHCQTTQDMDLDYDDTLCPSSMVSAAPDPNTAEKMIERIDQILEAAIA